MVAVEEKDLRDTDGLHSPEQKQTGTNRAGPPSPLHSSLQWKLGKKPEMCSHQKVFLQTLENDQSKRNKR